jgi:short-subunit dehydrogenase
MKAIISGATSGIGNAIALMLAREGWELAVISRNEGRLNDLMQELNEAGLQPHISFTGDLSKREDALAFAEIIHKKWAMPDLIINGAGEYETGDVSALTEEDINDALAVNFYSAFRLTSPWIGTFKQNQKGCVIFISSVVVNHPRKLAAAYSLSKTMLDTYAVLLADELRDSGVKVSRILPGSVSTPSWDGIDIPRDQLVQANEIAAAVKMIIELRPGSWLEEITLRPLNRNL